MNHFGIGLEVKRGCGDSPLGESLFNIIFWKWRGGGGGSYRGLSFGARP